MDGKEQEEAKKPSAATAPKRRKLLVVKRKKATTKKAAASSRGLPNFRKKTTVDAAANASSLSQHEQEELDNDPFDQVLSNLPNDTALGIQFLQQNTDTCLSIPMPADGNRSIRAVLQLHLHRKMQQNAAADVVSQELAQLFETNQIRQLASPSREQHPVQVIVLTADYELAARFTVTNNDDTHASSQQATEWMLRQLPHLTGQRIAHADWQDRWQADPITGSRLDVVLERLTRQQLLLLLPLEQSYQLWLPTWGVVLQAWETARKKALMHLKRSSYKERSLTAMQQKYSPIATVLVLDWMESIGEIEWIDRPAGKFVRLRLNEDDG